MDEKLRQEILDKIKPTKKEHNLRVKYVNNFIKKLEKSANKLNYKCEFFIGGSFGKNTYLKGTSDVDIFSRFSLKYKDEEISNYLKEILDNLELDYKIQKGSRDYFKLNFYDKTTKLNYVFELVPNRKIRNINDVLNSTDVSPLHVEFLQKKTKKNPNLCDEIRLAKQFFKSKKLYGAESYINGFSGHVIDILIAYYQTLENLLQEAKILGEETYIDINKFFKTSKDAKSKLEIDKHSNLLVIDPIIKTRNAAKALSKENYYRFLLISQHFVELKKSDFKIKKFDLYDTLKSYKKLVKLNNLDCFSYIFHLDKNLIESSDICGSKLLKLKTIFRKYFEKYDFDVFRDDFYIDFEKNICLFVFLFEKKNLPKIKKNYGPKIYMKNNVSKFLKKKDVFFVEEDRVYAYESRKIYKISQIAKINLSDCKEMFNKNLDFIKKVKIIKY